MTTTQAARVQRLADVACTIERYSNRHDWLHGRKSGLGGSDAAPVIGMGRFRGAYSVTTDKLTDGIDDSPEDETAEWGHRHESAIALKFSEVTGLTVTDPGDFTIFRSVERPHLFCTPDRLVGDDGVLEIKTAYFESGKAWAEKIPLGYQIQLQHTLYVTGRKRGWFAVLIDGHKFRYHPMARNERWIAKMLAKLDEFWASIQRGEYPNVDGSEATARALARRYPNPTAGQIELEAELQELGDEYDAILERGRNDEKRQLAIQNIIKDRLGEKTVGVLPNQSGFGWQMNGKGSRRFSRIKKVNVDG